MLSRILLWAATFCFVSVAASASTVRVRASFTGIFGLPAAFVADDLNDNMLIEADEIVRWYYDEHRIVRIAQDLEDYVQSGSTVLDADMFLERPVELFQPVAYEHQITTIVGVCTYRCLGYDPIIYSSEGSPITWSVMPVPAGAPLLLSAFGLLGVWRLRVARRRC